MGKYLIILFFCFFSVGSTVLSAEEKIDFKQGSHDFGTIEEKDGVVSHTFRFVNSGDAPVSILNVLSTCRCVTYSYSKAEVQPGAEGEIIVSFNPAYRQGFFEYDIQLRHSGSNQAVFLSIRGNVIPALHPIQEDRPYKLGEGLYSNLKVFQFGSVVAGESKSLLFRYGNGTEETMKLNFVTEGSSPGTLEIEGKTVLEPDERVETYAIFSLPKRAYGLQQLYVYPEVNGVKVSEPIKLTAIGIPSKKASSARAPKLTYSPKEFLLEDADVGQEFYLYITNSGTGNLRILSVDLPPRLSTDLYPGQTIEPESSVRVTLTVKEKLSTAEVENIYIVTNSPTQPYLRIRIRLPE